MRATLLLLALCALVCALCMLTPVAAEEAVVDLTGKNGLTHVAAVEEEAPATLNADGTPIVKKPKILQDGIDRSKPITLRRYDFCIAWSAAC
jgi:hypothetical protein